MSSGLVPVSGDEEIKASNNWNGWKHFEEAEYSTTTTWKLSTNWSTPKTNCSL